MKLYIERRQGKTGVTWQGTIYLSKQEGGPRRVPLGTFAKKGDLQPAADVEMDRLRLNLGIAAPDMTVAQLLDRWMKLYAADSVRPKTLHRYRELADLHIVPVLGQMRAAETPSSAVSEWQASMLAGDVGRALRPSTVRQARYVLNGAYKWAIRQDLLATNPVDRVKPPALKTLPMQPPDIAKVWKVVEASRGTWLYRPAMLLAATGTRRGEALALRWQDVDLRKREARIFRTLSSAHPNAVFLRPKTKAGERTIALPRFLVEEMKEWRGDAPDDTFICCHEDGSPLDPDAVSHAFYAMLRRKKIEPMRLHDFRHAVATQMLESGIRPDAVAAHLGHAGIVVTISVYGHLLTQAQHEAVSAFDDLMTRSR